MRGWLGDRTITKPDNGAAQRPTLFNHRQRHPPGDSNGGLSRHSESARIDRAQAKPPSAILSVASDRLPLPGVIRISEIEEQHAVGRKDSLDFVEYMDDAGYIFGNCFFQPDLAGDRVITLRIVWRRGHDTREAVRCHRAQHDPRIATPYLPPNARPRPASPSIQPMRGNFRRMFRSGRRRMGTAIQWFGHVLRVGGASPSPFYAPAANSTTTFRPDLRPSALRFPAIRRRRMGT